MKTEATGRDRIHASIVIRAMQRVCRRRKLILVLTLVIGGLWAIPQAAWSVMGHLLSAKVPEAHISADADIEQTIEPRFEPTIHVQPTIQFGHSRPVEIPAVAELPKSRKHPKPPRPAPQTEAGSPAQPAEQPAAPAHLKGSAPPAEVTGGKSAAAIASSHKGKEKKKKGVRP